MYWQEKRAVCDVMEKGVSCNASVNEHTVKGNKENGYTCYHVDIKLI